MDEGQVGQKTAEVYKTAAPRILENLAPDVGDVYDNITEFPREEGDGTEEIETSYETMTHTNRSIFYINNPSLKEDCWKGSRKQTEQLRFNTNIAARKARTGEGHANILYADADREERKVKLIDSASAGWVYVAAGLKKKGVTSERQPRQTKRLGLDNSDKETEHQCSDSDKGTEKERGDEESSYPDDDYELMCVRSSTVMKCQDHVDQALSDTSLCPSPVPRPRKERVSVLCTKPRPKPRPKSTCLQPNKGKQSSVSSSQSSTPPKLTLTDINSNLTSPPHIPQRTHGQFCQNKHESRDHRKRTPMKAPRSFKPTVITKESVSSFPNQKQPLLLLQSTSPDAKAPAQSKTFSRTPTSRSRDPDEHAYLEVLPEITTDDFSLESKDTQSSPPPRPPKSHLITKHTNSESRTAAPQAVDRCERSPSSPPMPPTKLKDNDGYLLPIDAQPLQKRIKTQSVAKEISPACSYQQDPPPRPPKTYTNRKSPTSSPTKGKPGTLLHNVSPALKPLPPPELSATLPRASPSILRSVGVTSDFNGTETPVHKFKSDFSTFKRDPGYGMKFAQGPWYASVDITRESFIDSCPSWSYEYIEEWVFPHQTSKEPSKDQNTAKQYQPNIDDQRQLRQSDGTIPCGQADGAKNTMADPYEDMGLQSSSLHRRNVEGLDVVEETEKACGQDASQYEEVDQYEDVDSRRNTAHSEKTDQYEEVIFKTATVSGEPSPHQCEDVDSHTVTTQNQRTGQYEDIRPSEKSSHAITTNVDAADGYEEVTTPIITATQSADQYEVDTQVLTHCEDLAPAVVAAAQFHTVEQEVAANSKLSATSGKDCKTVNETNNASESETHEKPTKSHKEAMKKIMTQMEHISLARGDDFEDVDTIQLYFAMKEGLRE